MEATTDVLDEERSGLLCLVLSDQKEYVNAKIRIQKKTNHNSFK
jgi:hypothetical protein